MGITKIAIKPMFFGENSAVTLAKITIEKAKVVKSNIMMAIINKIQQGFFESKTGSFIIYKKMLIIIFIFLMK